MKIDTLNNLNINEEAYIIENNVSSGVKQSLINLGLTKETKVKCLYRSLFNDPTAYLVKNVILAIREDDSKQILVIRKENGTY